MCSVYQTNIYVLSLVEDVFRTSNKYICVYGIKQIYMRVSNKYTCVYQTNRYVYMVPLAQCHDESKHSDIYEYFISREANTFRVHANKNVYMENKVHRHDESDVQYICLQHILCIHGVYM